MADKQSILAALADLLIFLSGAKSYWYTLNTCHEHCIHLANRFGMTHEHYAALLFAADLAKYVNGVLTIKLFQWENFLQGHHCQTYSELIFSLTESQSVCPSHNPHTKTTLST